MFADLSLDSVDDWIDLAERGGIDCIHLHGWWEWLGQYPVRKAYFPNGLDDMKAAVDRIHAAGLKVGMHSLTACINPHRDPWISPVCTTNLVADATYTLSAHQEIRRRTCVVGTFPDGNSALMLVCVRLRHVAGTQWAMLLVFLCCIWEYWG